MKKLEIIIQPGKFEDLKELLELCEYHGITITNIMGAGNQKGWTSQYRGTKTTTNLLPKLKVECVVTTAESEPIIQQVCNEIRTGNYGEGKIFIYEVADLVRIRTGARGESAL